MKKVYSHLFRIILFYLLVFLLARLAFFLVNADQNAPFNWTAALPSFLYGMRMDLSVIAYALAFPLALIILFLFTGIKWLIHIEYYFLLFIVLIFCLILPANILLYKYWDSLISFRSLSYLRDFKEIFSSFTAFQSIVAILLLILLILIFNFAFRRWAYRKIEPVSASLASRITGAISMLIILVLMIRGGIQMLPMNESLVSFSENNFINQATINPGWHLANDVYRAGIFSGNPFESMPEVQAKNVVDSLFACKTDSFPEILATKNPNIVILILESFTADIFEALGGEKGITPSLKMIIGEGILFDSLYASGTRTDQGIVSLLNGWPATPYYSIMRSSEKVAKLPSLPLLFLERGYTTSFYYGGKSNFSNLNVYCQRQKFMHMIDENAFDDAVPRGQWGVHDEYTLSRQLNDLSNSVEPFFSVLMTLSNHEPFDVPGPLRIPGDDDPSRFRNAAAYTDAMIGKYFSQAKDQAWFKNTLFILVADHGHGLPQKRNVYYPESHRIPMIFYGNVIKPEFRGAIASKLGGHHDLAATLLPQMGIASTEFNWSKNLLNPTSKPFAYYQIDHLVAWIDSNFWFGYSYNRKKFIARSYTVSEDHLEKMKIDGQAFVQLLYEQYRNY